MYGLKNVRNRRTDALTHVAWDQLETMLAVYYRGQGYRVDHVGTGSSDSRFDGGIDLKLYKDDAYIVVQCKHWNAKQVTHNAVHELIGVMVTEGASGAILVTSGEFSRYAIESAAKQGHVQLVDGDDLRGMLGPLPEVPAPVISPGAQSLAASLASTVGERLLGAAEARIRGEARMPLGGRGRARGRSPLSAAMSAGLWIIVVKLLFGLIIVLILTNGFNRIIGSLQPARGNTAKPAAGHEVLPTPGPVSRSGVLQGVAPLVQPDVEPYSNATGGPGAVDRYRAPTAAEIRESQRRADQAARILEASTPEM